MNNERRKRLKASIQLLHQSSEILVDVVTDEEDTLNGMPESLSHTERYQTMECAVDSLDRLSNLWKMRWSKISIINEQFGWR